MSKLLLFLSKKYKKYKSRTIMEKILGKLEPPKVWQYFEELTQVPRESKHEEKVIAFLLDFAKKHKLEAKKDDIGNILIKKPASKGMENIQSVVFQCHVDMVCTANKNVKIDFRNDPIQPYIDGEWVKAKGTSLGADDGIGVAMCMMLLTDETIQHGPIECLFTVDEETGLTGASALKEGFFDSKLLMNLDSEEEGEIFIGCAGGIDAKAEFEYIQELVPSDSLAFRFVINGLKGGHSGDEIHKGLGNANKIANRFLYLITTKYMARLSEFDGGDRHNAIPRFADFTFTVKKSKAEDLKNDFNIFVEEIKDEYGKLETNINIELNTIELPEFVIDFETQYNFTNALYVCPNGVHAMSLDISGLVETSTNLAVVQFRDPETKELYSIEFEDDNFSEEDDNLNEDFNINDYLDDILDDIDDIDDIDDDDDEMYAGCFNDQIKIIKVVTSQRSSIESGKRDINTMVKTAFKINDAQVTGGDGYPGWKPNPKSLLLKIAVDSYKRLFNKEPKVKAVHAGLECGLFLEKYPELDMISFGPTLLGVHSPDERIEIKTVKMWFNHIVDILKHIPTNK